MSVTSWFLVSSSGSHHRLPKELIFVGREDCELMLQSRSVDKQHAVINYDRDSDQHLVKDLGSLNGTFVNNLKIPDQTYVALRASDMLRFGYDSHIYVLEKREHKVPEEALKHEKYSSQLNLKKQDEPDDQIRSKTQGVSEAPVSRTPLYGQPSWWGEEEHQNQRSDELSAVPSTVQDIAGSDSTVFSLFQSNCFEIPTQDVSSVEGAELHEIPTKDTDTHTPKNQTQPVVQSHASFTIEFDSGAPGKMKIKDHITKFSMRQRKVPSSAIASAEALTAESKVADWLVHADMRRMRQHEPSEDVLSTKSDLAVHARILRGHHHEDGTQSDSEEHQPDTHLPTQNSVPLEHRLHSVDQEPESLHSESREFPGEDGPGSEEKTQVPAEQLPHQAFIIEFFDDDNPRKKRSQSFTHNPTNKQERRRGTERPASVHGHAPPTHALTGPMRMVGLGPQPRSSSLKREKTEAEASFTSRVSTGLRHLTTTGRKLPPDLLQKIPSSPTTDRVTTSSFPTSPGRKPLQAHSFPTESRVVSAPPPAARTAGLRTEEDDSLSDAGTYTIDTEGPDQEVEQARNMIDQVFGVLDSLEFSGGTRLADTVEVRCASSPQTTGPVQVNKKMSYGQGDPADSEAPKWVSRWASLVDPGSAPPVQGDDLGSSESRAECRTRRLLPQVPLDQLDAAFNDSAQDRSHAEDVDPDSLSDASRSDDGHKSRSSAGGASLQSTCFFIDSEDFPTRLDRPLSPVQPLPAKTPHTTVVIRHLSRSDAQRTGIKPNNSAPNLRLPDRDSIVRQESFTRDRPSEVQIKTLPHINSQPSLQTLQSHDTPEPEGDLHFVRPSGRVDDEASGESDVDTASTVSQVSSKNTPIRTENRQNSQRDRSSSGPLVQQKKKSFSGPVQRKQPFTARERLSEKRRHQGEPTSRSEEGKFLQSRRNTGTCGSLDTFKKQLGSGHVWTEPAGQDSSNRSKKIPDVKPSRTPQVLSRSNSLSAPRPTRASMLRRARLGEASDTDGGDTDRASQNSDHKGSADGKKLSRLDVLALPRRRTGSFNAPSDTEASTVGRSGPSKSTSEASGDTKRFPAGKASGALAKIQPTRSTQSTAVKNSESRSSSSEDELVRVNPPKHSKHSKARSSRPVSVETEEDEDPYQNWSNHSAEIAKLSQDLAKDLAILAREIHDVAGDGDLPESGTKTTPTSLPSTPAPVREELVQHIPEVGLSYQKVPLVSAVPADNLDSNMNRSEPGSKSHSAWNRQEVVLDNLMLSPVSQLSHMIRQNTEQLAQKMKVLLGSKADLWEEFESRINTDTEIPVLKTSNQEISAILMELRRVQRQLEAINSLVDAPPAVKEKKRSATFAPRSARGSDRANKS